MTNFTWSRSPYRGRHIEELNFTHFISETALLMDNFDSRINEPLRIECKQSISYDISHWKLLRDVAIYKNICVHIKPDYICEYEHSSIQHHLLSAAPWTNFGLYHTVGENAEHMIVKFRLVTQCVSSKILPKPHRNGYRERLFFIWSTFFLLSCKNTTNRQKIHNLSIKKWALFLSNKM